MVSEWSRVPISKVAYAVIGGTPSRKVPEYWHGDVPWATAKDVASVSGRYLNHVEEYITKEGLQNSAAKLLSKGTVVITARGTVGAVAQLGRDMAFNQTCYAILPKNNLDNNFLFYALKGTMIEMRALTYGTVFETITINTFDHWLIPLPPLPVQRAIAHILGTLDDKIELNRKMNETLDQMARALFKSWFIDFEPVRAKMEGRWKKGQSLPGLPAHLYDLFPDRLVNTQYGLAPAGWEFRCFEDLVYARQGKYLPDNEIMSNQTDEFLTPVWGGNGIRGYTKKKMYHKPIVILTCRGSNCGIINLSEGAFWVTNIAFACEPKIGSTYFIYIYFNFCSFKDYISGSAQPQITYNNLKKMKMPFPISIDICRVYSDFIFPIFNKIYLNKKEMQFLSSIRDRLLPKLIRGEIRLNE